MTTLKYNRNLYNPSHPESMSVAIEHSHRQTGATTAMLLKAIADALENPNRTQYVEPSMRYFMRKHEFHMLRELIEKLGLKFLDVKFSNYDQISITYNLYGTVERVPATYNIID